MQELKLTLTSLQLNYQAVCDVLCSLLFQNTMDTSELLLLLLLQPLILGVADPDHHLSTEQTSAATSVDHGVSTASIEPSPETTDSTSNTEPYRGDCLIDTEMGLVAVGSAGGLIVCLLVAVGVLTCQVCVLQRRVYVPRISRSNMDLVSSAGYWASDRRESGGIVGPCDTSVILEEVRADSSAEEERQPDTQGTAAGYNGGSTTKPLLPEEEALLTSSSKDSCLEIPRDLEDTPLVV